MRREKSVLDVGIDVGSTTTKIAAMDSGTQKILYSDYRRHHADQIKSVSDALRRLQEHFPDSRIYLALTGSGSKNLADELKVSYIQEVVANAIALQVRYEDVGTAIELGGQDAKIIFFRENETTHQLEASDMRMNGSCAGGTGAFIDEIASILNVPIQRFNEMAGKGTTVYDVSGRCGV